MAETNQRLRLLKQWNQAVFEKVPDFDVPHILDKILVAHSSWGTPEQTRGYLKFLRFSNLYWISNLFLFDSHGRSAQWYCQALTPDTWENLHFDQYF